MLKPIGIALTAIIAESDRQLRIQAYADAALRLTHLNTQDAVRRVCPSPDLHAEVADAMQARMIDA